MDDRLLEYRLPTWGITLLAAVGFVSSAVGFIVSLFSSYTRALPSAYVRPTPLIEVVIIGYSFVAVFVTFLVSIGLLARLNVARIVTMILAPAPFVGVVLEFVHSSLVNEIIGQDLTASQQASAITQLAPLGRLAVALEFTGVSFPGVAPVMGISLYGTAPYGMNPLLVVLGLLNLGVPFYLLNRHIKDAFRRRGVQKQD